MIDAAQLAGLTDLRAEKVMYWALRLVGDVSSEDPALRDAVTRLRAWQADGSLRRDADRDGEYDHAEPDPRRVPAVLVGRADVGAAVVGLVVQLMGVQYHQAVEVVGHRPR